MKFRRANLLLERLKEGQEISAKEDPENISLLKDLKLVDVKKDKVVLTKKGSLAAELEIQEYIKYHKTEKELLNFSPAENRRMRIILLLAFFLFFTMFLAAISTNLSLSGLF